MSQILKSIIYFDHESVDDDEYDEFIEDWKDQNDTDDMPEVRSWNYEDDLFSLKDILEQIPADADPKDIILSINTPREKNYIEFNLKKINS